MMWPTINNTNGIILYILFCNGAFIVHDQISETRPRAYVKFQFTHFHRCIPTYDERIPSSSCSPFPMLFPSFTTAEKAAVNTPSVPDWVYSQEGFFGVHEQEWRR